MADPTPLAAGLPPIWRADAQILILGSLPGIASLQAAEYYHHPRNQFWPMMQLLFEVDRALPYSERLKRLQQAKVALWDVIASARRQGSLDSAIESSSVAVNDLQALCAQLPQLQHIWLNGQTAFNQLQRYQKNFGVLPKQLQLIALPSTSPAHASRSFLQKQQHWQAALQQLTGPTLRQ